MGVGVAAKIFAICQPKKVSILLIRDEILRLHCLVSGYLKGKRANQGHT